MYVCMYICMCVCVYPMKVLVIKPDDSMPLFIFNYLVLRVKVSFPFFFYDKRHTAICMYHLFCLSLICILRLCRNSNSQTSQSTIVAVGRADTTKALKVHLLAPRGLLPATPTSFTLSFSSAIAYVKLL